MTSRAATGEPAIGVLRDADAVSAAAADQIADLLRDAVDARGRADWATTGGSAPIGIYRRLGTAPFRETVPWFGVHLWWGDDRYVPRDHPLSNILPADQILLAAAAHSGTDWLADEPGDAIEGLHPGAPLPIENVHPFPTGEAIGEARGPEWAAAQYEVELRGAGLETRDGWPVFDLVLLGVGPDGHILSVFPGPTALDETAWALAVPAPTHVEPHVARVTLNPRVLDVARHVLVVVHGAAKAEVVATIFGGERDPLRWPAQLVRRRGVGWLLDEAAAARLPRGLR
jgi:6-phosphogluconolactonase